MKPNFTGGSATIGTTEYSLPNASTTLTAQTDDAAMQAWIDFANMAPGDQYLVKLYEKINGGTARAIVLGYVTGAQTEPFVTPYLILGEGWDLTLKKTSGTDRSIAWSIRKQIEGETVVVGSIAAGAITAAAIATDAIDADALKADAITEIQAGLATAAGLTSAVSPLATAAGLASAVSPLALSTQVDALEGGLLVALADIDDVQARLPAALVGGRIDASVGAVAANAITAAAVAADVTTELQAGLATSAGLTSAVAPLATTAQLAAAVSPLDARLPAELVDGRIDANVGDLAVGIAGEIALAVWAFAHESGRTAKGVLVRLDALMTGKATGLLGALATFYRADGTTPAMAATQDTAAGTRQTASTVAGD